MNKFTVAMLVVTGLLFNTAKAQVCDTINLPLNGSWTPTAYVEETFFPGVIAGYVSGINIEDIPQQANYFDLSGTSNTHILGVIVSFSKANSNVPGNLSKNIIFRVYADDGTGKPGSELTNGSTIAQKTLSSIKSDVDAGKYTTVNFPSAIALPVSKKFYVSVDVSNFTWSVPDNIRDSICVTTTAQKQTANTAWGYDNAPAKWKTYSKLWDAPPAYIDPLEVTLFVFPYVSTSAGGCGVLPVQLLSFTASRNTGNVDLKWQIASEFNMKGYEVEKADNNNLFKTVATINAVNSIKNETYAATDKNAFGISKIVQYRLKQIDGDGSITHSRIVTVNGDNANTDLVFANPFIGALSLQLNLTQNTTASFRLYDIQGRVVASQPAAQYAAGTNNIQIKTSSQLKPGSYLLEMIAGTEKKVYKIIKQ
ncbi:T9SS type A sorting domain-containing protein [Limnovirga soli]|uniref:T9SS type A sorting domain-containing protein n=1 Tax=Limnovirga soli TaxID=2656915 RepID=A0A8J8FGC7_9BACT|nr:T9SS type A sorting domain-containing protein [Limnovirga soli]NNV55874.1 T9SS type A sorting domain-containing protein [Limnovirga soli]